MPGAVYWAECCVGGFAQVVCWIFSSKFLAYIQLKCFSFFLNRVLGSHPNSMNFQLAREFLAVQGILLTHFPDDGCGEGREVPRFWGLSNSHFAEAGRNKCISWPSYQIGRGAGGLLLAGTKIT